MDCGGKKDMFLILNGEKTLALMYSERDCPVTRSTRTHAQSIPVLSVLVLRGQRDREDLRRN